MALWEYKVITSGPHGFASPALLEAHLNALGKDEWEIIHFQTLANNALAFHGLARRSTMRDWSPPPELAVASPPRPPVDHGPIVTKTAPISSKPEPESLVARIEEKADATPPLREETLRPMRDTERDLDPDVEEEEDDWDNWEEESDDLPNFFEAIKPHLRRNQKGPGMSVALDYLAKRWDQREADLIGALKECGFTVPETEDAEDDFFEFEGDLYWVNRNNRGQLFINTREKPRPVFRIAQAKKLAPDDPATADIAAERAAEKAEIEKRKLEQQERAERQAAARAAAEAAAAARNAARDAAREAAREAREAARDQGPAIADQPDSPSPSDEPESASTEPAGPMPSGAELLERIKPLMRRNRRGPGYSGSVGYLARALKQSEADVTAALAALGLNAPASSNDKPIYVEVGQGVYWMNKDNRGGIWINGREKRESGQKADRAEGSNQPQTEEANGGERVPGGDAPGSSEVTARSTSAPAAPSESAFGGSSETSANPAPAPAPAEPSSNAGANAGEPVPPMTRPEPLVQEGVPAREVDPRPAEVTSPPSESSASEASSAESSESAESPASEPKEGESEAARASKPARPRRTGATRSRTRKPKTDTGSELASPVQEDDVAKSDDSPAKPDEPGT